jgi:hypothetical protein
VPERFPQFFHSEWQNNSSRPLARIVAVSGAYEIEPTDLNLTCHSPPIPATCGHIVLPKLGWLFVAEGGEGVDAGGALGGNIAREQGH